MPYLPNSNFLFIHIPKNGGKYVEDRLFMSDNPGNNENQTNRSFLSNVAKYILNRYSKKSKLFLRGMIDYSLVGQHLTLSEICILNLIDNLHSKNIICICRNPYSRIISLFCHHVKPEKWNITELEHFCKYWPYHKPTSIKHNILAHKRTQYAFIDNYFLDNQKVDIYKLEDLDIDLIANKYKLHRIPETAIIPKNKLNPLNNRSYSENCKKQNLSLTPIAVKYVRDYYGIDFERFQYFTTYDQ
ncbi:sulfotransferase family 2 domain-containing protein [Synechococcus sp. ROS8604]|uniref:sulfotransferase family 2 domain-containing protein n=1 Tax=Synechococcus sp. ROS8604 TaxID=1442557 RepID=UPI001644AEC2|nr:sulfotransferase family 2 domain-containing protein [Synechococcus sp. ROS8604]QNI86957.1 hypothetical protein SynROS8604_00286 [Synechococcus sp. ROS8604]